MLGAFSRCHASSYAAAGAGAVRLQVPERVSQAVDKSIPQKQFPVPITKAKTAAWCDFWRWRYARYRSMLPEMTDYQSKAEARREMSKYIRSYVHERRHSSLDDRSPAQFELIIKLSK